MSRMLGPEKRIAVFVAAFVFLIAAIALTQTIPAVQGLGDKVRLPMFHGASTWVNLGAFSLMGLAGLGYVLTKRPTLYRWSAGFRWVASTMWLANTALGVIAAMNTWDFTGSKSAPFMVIREDPRLMAQFILLIVIAAVLLFQHIAASDTWRAFMDAGYAALLWVVLGLMVFGNAEARALHPDSPVLNSGSEIQLPFFAILACLSVATILAAWLVADHVARAE
ncbi:MAG: hypothetical protein ACYC6C_02075 [Coriobacteriia bacterium]